MADRYAPLSERLYNDFCLDQPEFSDMTISTADADFRTHKMVVCSLSPVIKERLAAKENKPNVVSLPSYDTYAVGALLKYCYHGAYQLHDPIDEANTNPVIAHLHIYRLSVELNIPSLRAFALARFQTLIGKSVMTTAVITQVTKIIYNQIDVAHRQSVKEMLLAQLSVKGKEFVYSDAFRNAVRESGADLAVDLCQYMMRQPHRSHPLSEPPEERPAKRNRRLDVVPSPKVSLTHSDVSTLLLNALIKTLQK